MDTVTIAATNPHKDDRLTGAIRGARRTLTALFMNAVTAYHHDMDNEPDQPPIPSLADLDRSDADATAGRVVPFEQVRRMLRTSIARTQAKGTASSETSPAYMERSTPH